MFSIVSSGNADGRALRPCNSVGAKPYDNASKEKRGFLYQSNVTDCVSHSLKKTPTGCFTDAFVSLL
jgi:hypothetical protein